MTLSQREISEAAERATTLSQLLEQETLFTPDSLRWLTPEDVDKFSKGIDAAESAKLMHLAAKWRYSGIDVDAVGFPVLDWLWVTGVEVGFFGRSSLSVSNSSGSGRGLVVCLAEFQPEWVGGWWQWRCANKQGGRFNVGVIEEALIDALTSQDLASRLSLFGNDVAAAIIAKRPEFFELLPAARRGVILRSALEEQSEFSGVVEALSEYEIPSNAIAVVNAVFEGVVGLSKPEKESQIIDRLDALVTRWKGRPGSDPIASAMIAGHKRLETLLRSPWNQALVNRNEDKIMWSDRFPSWGAVRRVFVAAARVVPEKFKLEVGFSIGVRFAERGLEPSEEQVAKEMETLYVGSTRAIVHVLMPMVRLWAALRTIAKYEPSRYAHDTELVGLGAKVRSLVDDSPGLWAESLPWILARSSKLGNIAEAVTVELARNHTQVRSALDRSRHAETEQVRLLASGLWALLHGIEDPGSGLARTLADAAARHMDGVPIFPHPLEPMSATWIGSIGVEQAITNGVRRATTRFATEVRNQGGNIEEALTNSLIKEIEVEFRNVQLRLRALGSSGRSPAPILSVKQRPASKSIEEPVYGCDLAWLLHATVQGAYLSTWVDLVQVKKSKALQRNSNRKSSATNSWKIETKQLSDILKWSATAVYWLIASEGEVLVVPAKHLLGIKRGRSKRAAAESFTVGYHDVRSAAIPLEQYLVDLLIGQWLGTTSEDAVRFVEGDSNIRPMSVVEITISVGLDNQ